MFEKRGHFLINLIDEQRSKRWNKSVLRSFARGGGGGIKEGIGLRIGHVGVITHGISDINKSSSLSTPFAFFRFSLI